MVGMAQNVLVWLNLHATSKTCNYRTTEKETAHTHYSNRMEYLLAEANHKKQVIDHIQVANTDLAKLTGYITYS
jgi:hypothetical protein